MASSSNGSHGGDDASRSRRKAPDHLLKYFDPAFVESRSPRNTFVWEHIWVWTEACAKGGAQIWDWYAFYGHKVPQNDPPV